MRAALLLLLLAGCATPSVECILYGEARLSMPRPLGEGPLPEWVASLDDRMTGGCRS